MYFCFLDWISLSESFGSWFSFWCGISWSWLGLGWSALSESFNNYCNYNWIVFCFNFWIGLNCYQIVFMSVMSVMMFNTFN